MSSRIAVLCTLALLNGCAGSPAADSGASFDGAVPRDGGRRDAAGDAGPIVGDAGRIDAGVPDPCEADEEDADTTVGCNGAVRGAAAANALGGDCTTSAASGRGSCTDATASCDDSDEDDVGQCLLPCTPGGSYVSTGGCPAGTRCFDFGVEGAYCYADCTVGTDCASAMCDADGSCVDRDACASDDATTVESRACNGAVLDAQAANANGGSCTPSASGFDRGSCTDPDAYCDDADEDLTGVCILDCESTGDFYVSDGGCPTGFRCFDFGEDGAYCYAVCNIDSDCGADFCDEDFACSH